MTNWKWKKRRKEASDIDGQGDQMDSDSFKRYPCHAEGEAHSERTVISFQTWDQVQWAE